jgi:hypothetical protein
MAAVALAGCESNRQASDEALNTEVKQNISTAKVPGTIDARADDGVVTLTGTVPDLAAKMRAEDVTIKVKGVTRVVNNLRTTAAADAPQRPAVNLPPNPPAEGNVPPAPEVR